MSKRKRDRSSPTIDSERINKLYLTSSSTEQKEFSKTNLRYDLVLFLAVAQYFSVDFLPITWQQALGSAGEGGAAEIRQSVIDIERNFAFKRAKTFKGNSIASIYQVLVSEISILAHPCINLHPHIVTLLGVSWEVSDDIAWPVLVFKKSEFGNLKDFFHTEAGRALGSDERLRLCAVIATAVRDMHVCQIIHGDIKPENILIFKDNETEEYTARVTDFGYSVAYGGETNIHLPQSKGWTAPEWHHRGFTYDEAVKTDVYSFSLLCLWLLHFYHLDHIPDGTRQALPGSIHTLARGTATHVQEILRLGLANDPSERNIDFQQIASMLGATREVIDGTDLFGDIPLYSSFNLANSISQLYATDYRVRRQIFESFLARAKDSSKLTLSDQSSNEFELALCYRLGFGTAKDAVESRIHLENSQLSAEELQQDIEVVMTSNLFYMADEIHNMVHEGVFPVLDFANYYREQDLVHIESIYRREIENITSELGPDHIITRMLKYTLSEMLFDIGRWTEAEALEKELLDLNEQVLGKEHSNTLSTMSTLAAIYQKQGRFQDAEKLGEHVVEAQTRIHGLEHPKTITSMGNLAMAYMEGQNFEKAEALELKVLQELKSVFGVKHPETLGAMHNLSVTYGKLGRWQEAEELALQVIEISPQVCGSEHPNTLTSMGNLAQIYSKKGLQEKALELDQRVAEISTAYLGRDHPDTLLALANLATTYHEIGALDKAEQIGIEVLGKTAEKFGAEHTDTLLAQSNLAMLYMSQQRWKDALLLVEDVVKLSLKVLGDKHEDTIERIKMLQEIKNSV